MAKKKPDPVVPPGLRTMGGDGGFMIRDRVKEFRRVPASQLAPSPLNWRTHPRAQQDALRGLLAEVGFAGAVLARELPGGGLQLIDGHLRVEALPQADIPVLVLDVTEEEAKKLLATLDPLGALAEADAAKLDALLRDVQTGSEAVAALLTDLAQASGVIPGLQAPGGGGDEFDATPAEAGPTRCQVGDLWLIGCYWECEACGKVYDYAVGKGMKECPCG